jgi:hypothetical protein
LAGIKTTIGLAALLADIAKLQGEGGDWMEQS